MLQEFVQATHRVPFLSHGYRVFYAAVLNRFIAMVRKHAAVETVMLKGSYARNEHVPGMSDIDLAIVIRDNTTFDEMCEIANSICSFKQGKVLSKCPIVGEIEIFTRADVTSRMFQAYARRFSWRVVSGQPVAITNCSSDAVEKVWAQFGKFAFFHTVARTIAAPKSLLHRDSGLANALGVREVSNDHLQAYISLVRRFEELLAPFVSADDPYPKEFVADHVGPFTGCGDMIKKQYILVEDFEIPKDATEIVLDAAWSECWWLTPSFVGPNAMRFVIGPFGDRGNRMWSEMNLQTVRYQWRGGFLNNVTSEGFLSRYAYNDLVRLMRTLSLNSLMPDCDFEVPAMVRVGEKVDRAGFQELYEVLASVQYPEEQ